jgi:tripartite tricarboxylate transporter TctA family protein
MTDQSRNRYSWLEATAVRNASDIVLGCVLLAAAATAVLGSRGLSVGTLEDPGSGFFPSLLGWLLAGTGILLLARGALGGLPPPIGWRIWQVSILIGLIAAVILGRWFWGSHLLLLFGPAEHAATILLALSIAIAVSRLSRLRAVGLVLLGLLLPVVGLDAITGQLRLTMGVEQLLQGFDFLVVAPGLILVADGLVCLVSPALLLTTYTRRMSGWRDPTLPPLAAFAMRLAAALVIAASCYLAFKVFERLWDVGLLGLFGVLGVACKVLGWSRLVLLVGFAYSEPLEQGIRHAMLAWSGDVLAVLGQPLTAALLAAAGIVLAAALALSLRRGIPPAARA